MQRIRHRVILCLAVFLWVIASGAGAQEMAPPPVMEVLISIADQKMAVIRDGGLLHKYPVSTSRFGVGDAYRSYKTPLGILRVCDKVGGELLPGSVIKHREATGEVLDVNAPGRDPIVTRILWLEGIEEQNRNAKERGIYIHGTPEEKNLGRPVSWGCIRMRSVDVMELYDEIPVGVEVCVIADKLPHYPKWEPPKLPPVIIVAHTPAPAPVVAAAAPASASGRVVAAVSTPGPGRVVIAAYNPPSKSLSTTSAPASTAASQSHIVSVRWSEKPLSAVSAPIIETTSASSDGGRKKKKIYETEEGAFDAMHSSMLFANMPDPHAPPVALPTPGVTKPADHQ